MHEIFGIYFKKSSDWVSLARGVVHQLLLEKKKPGGGLQTIRSLTALSKPNKCLKSNACFGFSQDLISKKKSIAKHKQTMDNSLSVYF